MGDDYFTLGRPHPITDGTLRRKRIIVIAMGLRSFGESLQEQEVEVVQVDWTPPAGGDKELADLLEKLL